MSNSQAKTNTLPAKLKAERPMPKWVTEANERIGPKPPAPPPNTINGASTPRPPALPPKKNQPEPDYEVIEFSGQQYSNEPTLVMRPKTPDARRPESAMKCTLCGSNNPWVTCDECAQQIFCASCDDMFHKHPKRKTHLRKAIELKRGSTPLIPPKAAPNPAPIAPPRRNKKGMPSPMPLRRDQVIGSAAPTPTSSPIPGQQQAWQDRLGSLKRGLNLSSRPLPETPRTPSDGVSSRSTTPNSKSVFDTIQRPPSITLEKIKNKASATLDRMALLQQRYRQHKEAKANDKSNGPLGNSRDQNLPFDQWSNISSPSHFRSGSMSSGINSFDFPDESQFSHFQQQFGMRNGNSARNMSSSVFNLNQVSQRPTDHNSPMWMGGSQMQQAQSMAQLNCINCSNQRSWNQPHHHPDEWPGASNANLNRSNMSLNVTHGFYPSPHQQHMMHPPPVFMNMPGLYPYPMGVGMPAMNPTLMGMPSTARSRATSRAGSRVPSPTLSRKSMQVRKKRNNFTENELTDDEDSDNDDRRSLMSQRSGIVNQRRGRRVSSASQALPLDEDDEPRQLRSKILAARDRRAPSIPKSVQSEWTPNRRTSASSNTNANFSSYKKVYSDSPISPDSEASEAPPTRALVQAKIEEKLKESTRPKLKTVPIPVSDDDNPKIPSDNVDENQYQNANDLKEAEEQIEEPIADDSASLGPPPSTPEHEWECEFCTFVNEAKTKICSICCKTPQRAPTKVAPVNTSAKTATITNGIGNIKVSQPADDPEDHIEAAKKKDNTSIEDIWATLDENIQAEANKVKRNAETNTESKKKDKKTDLSRAPSVTKEKKAQKVSTGCGPSPPKEIKKELRSTGTSPVPQSISTQTYDCIPGRTEPEQDTAGTLAQVASAEIQSQSFTPPTRNFSPKEMFTPTHNDTASSREIENFASLERNLRFYRDMSVPQGDRYRSSNDIRLDELPPSVIQSRPSVSDYLSMQKAQIYHNDNFFDQYAPSKRNEPTRDPEIELFMMLKEAEHYKFTAEELHAALKHCGDTHPIVWLRENWSKLIQTVQSLATKYGQERIENVIGTISAIEAREALRMHGGNVWQAISECVEQRQRKYLEISAKGNYSREDIVTALTAHHGNVELAVLDLSKTQLKPFLMRVWGSPGGVENESANYMPPPPKTEVSSPIHEFLTANADQLTFTQDQAHFRNTSSVSNLSSYSHESRDDAFVFQNKNVLKDLETLIGNMEQDQAKQNGQVLRSIEDMLGNLLAKKPVEAEIDVESDRVFMKSPILTHRSIGSSSNKATDVKNFVWQHIQEIVPNLVEQVEKELLEEEIETPASVEPPPVPIDADEFLMEEVIKPNLKHCTEEETLQLQMHEVSPIADFKVVKDRGSPRKQKEELKLNSFENAPRAVFKMAIAPESSDYETSEEESSQEESSEEEDTQEENAPSLSEETTEALLTKKEFATANSRNNEKRTDSISGREEDSKKHEELTPKEHIESHTAAENKSTGDERGIIEIEEASTSKPTAPIATKDTEDEPQENDARGEAESNANKNSGFRAYSLRIGFNSLRKKRRQRSRKSIKREKVIATSDIVTNESDIVLPQLNSNDQKNDVNAPSSVKNQLDHIATLDNRGPSTDGETDVLKVATANELDRDESAQSNQNRTTNGSEKSADNLGAKPSQEKNTSEPNSTNSSKSARKPSHIPSLPKPKQIKQQATSKETASQKSEVPLMHADDSIFTQKQNATTGTPEKKNISKIKLKKQRLLTALSPSNAEGKEKLTEGGTVTSSSLNKNSQTLNEADMNKPTTSSSVKAVERMNTSNTKLNEPNQQVNIEELLPVSIADSQEGAVIANISSNEYNTSHSIQQLNNSPTEDEAQSVKDPTIAANAEKIEIHQEKNYFTTPQSPKKKQSSRIPVRRTISSTSLKSTESVPTSPTSISEIEGAPAQPVFQIQQQTLESEHKATPTEDEEFYDDIQSSEEEEPDFFNVVEDIVQIKPVPPAEASKDDDENSDQELYSVDSDDVNPTSPRDLMQSPTSESEVFLIIRNEQNLAPLETPSPSSRTITPMSTKSSEFKYSDPSKQNLSELVEDTQRLIKQMKEEINIDMAAFDSEDEYSEDYSYEEYKEEYEEEEEDNTNDAEDYEEEGTEDEEIYSNVELDSEADIPQENEGSLKDVEEVDELEYTDAENETNNDNTEVDQHSESFQVTLSHKPSTDNSPLIAVESSTSNESLTNPTHVAIGDHYTISVIPGLSPIGSPQSERYSVEEQNENDIVPASDAFQSIVLSNSKTLENQTKTTIQEEPARSTENARALPEESSIPRAREESEESATSSPKRSIVLNNSETLENQTKTTIQEESARSSENSIPLPKESSIPRAGEEPKESARPTTSSHKQPIILSNSETLENQTKATIQEESARSGENSRTWPKESSIPRAGEEPKESARPTTSSHKQPIILSNSETLENQTKATIQEESARSGENSRTWPKESSIPRAGEEPKESARPTTSSHKHPIILSNSETLENQTKTTIQEESARSSENARTLPKDPSIPNEIESFDNQIDTFIKIHNNGPEEPRKRSNSTSLSNASNILDEESDNTAIIEGNYNRGSSPANSALFTKAEATIQDNLSGVEKVTPISDALIDRPDVPTIPSEELFALDVIPSAAQSVDFNEPSTSNSIQSTSGPKRPIFASQIDIVLENTSQQRQSHVIDKESPVNNISNPMITEVRKRTLSPSASIKSLSPSPTIKSNKDTSSPESNTASSQIVATLKELLKVDDTHSELKVPQTDKIQGKKEVLQTESTLQTFPDNVDVQLKSPAAQVQVTEDNKRQSIKNIEPPSNSIQSRIENNQSEEYDDIPGTSKDSNPRKSPPNKSASKIPKPKGNTKTTSIPTRSKSFSGPAPIGISSVRAIQQELFNKQSQLAKPSSVTQKLQPPTLVRKKSITEAISRFTQVTAQHAVQRSRTQPKIPKVPKKKYHETCFSDDDYQETTSEDEAPQPVEVRLRKQSAPVFRTYPSIQEPEVEKPEVLARRLIDEQLVSNLAEAQLAAALVGMKFQQDVSVWAARECCDLDQAISLLQQDCELCMGSYPMNQIVSMLKCTHKCCKECAKNYFTIQITDRSINDCNCPFCKTPELHDSNVNEDENLEYFSNLDIFLKNILEPEVHELFQRKLRDRTLMQDPNFKWCIQCSSGFFARPKQKRLICPDCGSVTCSQCRKTWEKQHEGLSCEKFQEWKEANDPEVQAKGVADHLAINGIDCPKCHFKYSLARGGCMHFTCTQCKFEFCFGCSRPFMMGAKCGISPYCSKLGLHAHHPRSCLFYLRDKNPLQLQNLLKQNNVTYDVDPISSDQADGASSTPKCPIPLQKETPKGLVDTVCNSDVQQNHAGLCRQHYVEYLAAKVAKAGIDPLPILDLTDCVQELRRRGVPLPERGPWDTDEIYRNMCSKVIKDNIPLE